MSDSHDTFASIARELGEGRLRVGDYGGEKKMAI